MSDIAAQIALLKDMYAKGVLTLTQGGETVTFASGDEILRRIAVLEAWLAKSQGATPATVVHYVTFDKGF